jgi:hypothetical protein
MFHRQRCACRFHRISGRVPPCPRISWARLPRYCVTRLRARPDSLDGEKAGKRFVKSRANKRPRRCCVEAFLSSPFHKEGAPPFHKERADTGTTPHESESKSGSCGPKPFVAGCLHPAQLPITPPPPAAGSRRYSSRRGRLSALAAGVASSLGHSPCSGGARIRFSAEGTLSAQRIAASQSRCGPRNSIRLPASSTPGNSVVQRRSKYAVSARRNRGAAKKRTDFSHFSSFSVSASTRLP